MLLLFFIRSREEIEVWKEKQRQVQLEEQHQGSNFKLVTSFQAFSKGDLNQKLVIYFCEMSGLKWLNT